MTTLELQVWNRAAMHGGGAAPRAGDAALSALLIAHGYVMNGGVVHALEGLDADELARAIEGYRFFGLASAAQVLEQAIKSPRNEETEHRLNAAYAEVIPNDDAIGDRFKEHLAAHPELYAPLANAPR